MASIVKRLKSETNNKSTVATRKMGKPTAQRNVSKADTKEMPRATAKVKQLEAVENKLPLRCRVIASAELADICRVAKPKLLTNRGPKTNERKTNEVIEVLPLKPYLPVLTEPKKSYNTRRLFFVPLLENDGARSKRSTPHDFQQFLTAAERYSIGKFQPTIQVENSVSENLLETLLPPPAQFADPMDTEKLCTWRLQREKTVTLYYIPKSDRNADANSNLPQTSSCLGQANQVQSKPESKPNNARGRCAVKPTRR